jgi:hypothetical protein
MYSFVVADPNCFEVEVEGHPRDSEVEVGEAPRCFEAVAAPNCWQEVVANHLGSEDLEVAE